jgi:hypothetical protein
MYAQLMITRATFSYQTEQTPIIQSTNDSPTNFCLYFPLTATLALIWQKNHSGLASQTLMRYGP